MSSGASVYHVSSGQNTASHNRNLLPDERTDSRLLSNTNSHYENSSNLRPTATNSRLITQKESQSAAQAVVQTQVVVTAAADSEEQKSDNNFIRFEFDEIVGHDPQTYKVRKVRKQAVILLNTDSTKQSNEKNKVISINLDADDEETISLADQFKNVQAVSMSNFQITKSFISSKSSNNGTRGSQKKKTLCSLNIAPVAFSGKNCIGVAVVDNGRIKESNNKIETEKDGNVSAIFSKICNGEKQVYLNDDTDVSRLSNAILDCFDPENESVQIANDVARLHVCSSAFLFLLDNASSIMSSYLTDEASHVYNRNESKFVIPVLVKMEAMKEKNFTAINTALTYLNTNSCWRFEDNHFLVPALFSTMIAKEMENALEKRGKSDINNLQLKYKSIGPLDSNSSMTMLLHAKMAIPYCGWYIEEKDAGQSPTPN